MPLLNYILNMIVNKIYYELNPQWVTGFVDGEGCFTVAISMNKLYRIGWQVKPSFKIKLHIRDKDLLDRIRLFFNVGTVVCDDNSVCYNVRDRDDIMKIIIPHFEKYPLITQKQNDFLLFKSILERMNRNEHLNLKGLIEIINIKAYLNRGLSNLLNKRISDNLNMSLPNTIKLKMLEVVIPTTIDYNWLAGFFSGEGCFFVEKKKSKAKFSKTGFTVGLRIYIGQHIRDKLLINSFIKILECGSIKYSTKNFVIYSVSNFENIYNKIIPLFKKHKIEGKKLLDFQDFCKVAELINKKANHTKKGMKQIILIKSRMNKARY